MEGTVSRQLTLSLPVPHRGYMEIAGEATLPEGALVRLVNGVSSPSGVHPLPTHVALQSVPNSRWWVETFANTPFFFNFRPDGIDIYVLHRSLEERPTDEPFYRVQTIPTVFSADLSALTVLRYGNALVLFFAETKDLYLLTFTQGAFVLTQHTLPFIARFISTLNEWRLFFGYIFEDSQWHPRRVRWTDFHSLRVDPLSFVDLPEASPIIGLAAFEGQLVVFREDGIDLLQPTGDALFPFRVVPSLRFASFRPPIDIAAHEDALYFLSANGRYYRTDGRRLEELSVVLEPLFAHPFTPDRPTRLLVLEHLRQVWLLSGGHPKTLGFSLPDGTFYETDNREPVEDWRRGVAAGIVTNRRFAICREIERGCHTFPLPANAMSFRVVTLEEFARLFPTPSVPDAASVALPDHWQFIAIGKTCFVFPAPDRLTQPMQVTYPFLSGEAPMMGKRALWLRLNIVPLRPLSAFPAITVKVVGRFYLPRFYTQERQQTEEVTCPVPETQEARLPLSVFGQRFQVTLLVPANCPVRLQGGQIAFVPYGTVW